MATKRKLNKRKREVIEMVSFDSSKGLVWSKTIWGLVLTIPSVVGQVMDVVQSPEVAGAVAAVSGGVGAALILLGRVRKGIKEIRGLF